MLLEIANSIRHPVLMLDDDINVLHAMKRLFHGHPKVDLMITDSPAVARKTLDSKDVHVLVTDQRMPESSGVEMLAYAKKVRPETICILLTGHADTEVLAESINTGNIRRYYHKPVDPAAFIQDMEEFVRDFENRNARSSTEIKNNSIFRRTLDTSRKTSGADVGSSYCTEKTKDDKPRLLVQNSGTHSHSLPTMGSELPMDEDLERIGLTLDSVYRYQKLHYAQLEARLASKSDSEKINRTIMKAELAEECNKVLADIRITKKALINLSSQKVITHPD